MSLWTWLQEKVGKGNIIPISQEKDFVSDYCEVFGDVYIREMMFWQAVNLIARAVGRCEFRTFYGGVEEKKRWYYQWNIEPNPNQNANEFWMQALSKLYRHNECLIIENKGHMYVADSFTVTPYALYEDVFRGVQVKGFTFDRAFKQSEVLFFSLNEVNMRNVLNGLYVSYSKLIEYSMKAYQRSRGTKGVFKYDTLPVAGTPEREAFDRLVNKRISEWLSSDTAALPLGRGQDWVEPKDKTYASESTRDIRALVDDIGDFTARAFGIPPVLMNGSVQETTAAIDQFLTFCIDPLADMIAAEINRKTNGYEGFRGGDYLQIDTKTIKHTDLLGVATSIDKLISSGVFSINDIRGMVNEPLIAEPWADEHFITKNYENMQSTGGGNG